MNAITVFTKPQNCYLGQNRKAVIQSVMTSAILKTLGPFMHSVSGIKARKEKKRKRKKKKYIKTASHMNQQSCTYLRDMYARSHGDR